MAGRSTGNIGGPVGTSVSEAARALLESGAQRLGLGLPSPTLDRLLELGVLLHSWSSRMNLTGHASLEALTRELILDSLDLAAHLPPFDTLADVGSGAGIPGLPLALAFPERRIVLVESRERRHHFQQAARRRLALSNVELRHGRAEALEPTPCAIALGRAVARPVRALGWLVPWAREGGLVAIPGASAPPALPLDDASGRTCDARIERWRRVGDGAPRSLWLARRS